MESARIRIAGIHDVQLAIPSDREATPRAFYGNVLGLREMKKPSSLASRGGCWFEGPRVQVHLAVEDPFSPPAKAHPAFVVEDIDAAEQALTKAGSRVVPDASLPKARRL